MKLSLYLFKSIRRINATPLYIKAGNWGHDLSEIARYLTSIYSTPQPRLAGVTSTRCLLLGKNTPWNRVRFTLGFGTNAVSLADDKLAGKPICTTSVARRVEHRDVRHEIQRLEDNMRAAITVRHLELVTDIP